MRVNVAGLCLGALLAAPAAWAQEQTNPESQVVSSTQRAPEASSPDYTAVYCASFVSDERMPGDLWLVSGEESNSRIVFTRGDNVYLNKGSNQGIHVGDRFFVIRPESDPNQVPWFQWQHKLMKAMGTLYRDKGQLRVVNVQPNTSVAEIGFSCGYMQRGDIVRPMQERPSPPYKAASEFDHFAPPSGKPVGTIVLGQDHTQSYGKFTIVYVNLGSNQGVTVGSYLRIFRYQGKKAQPETAAYIENNFQYAIYGFGGSPTRYSWNDLPRQVLGEGIVLNVSRNSATMFVTYTQIEGFAGDYVELE